MAMPPVHIIPAPTTGQTPLYCDQVQPWAVQHIDDHTIECYCLDAPEYVPSGSLRLIGRNGRVAGRLTTQAMFVNRA